MFLQELAKELGVKPAKLLKDFEKIEMPLADETVDLDADELAAIRELYAKMPPKKKPPPRKKVEKPAEPKAAKPKAPKAAKPKKEKEGEPAVEKKTTRRTTRKRPAAPEEAAEVGVATLPRPEGVTPEIGAGEFPTVTGKDTALALEEPSGAKSLPRVAGPRDKESPAERGAVAVAEPPQPGTRGAMRVLEAPPGIVKRVEEKARPAIDEAARKLPPPPRKPLKEELSEEEKAPILPVIAETGPPARGAEFDYSDYHIKVERIRKPRPVIRKEIVKRRRLKRRDVFDRPGIVPRVGKIPVSTPTTVNELSQALGIKASLMIAKLMENDMFFTVNDYVSEDVVEMIAKAFDLEIEISAPRDVEKELEEEVKVEENKENLVARAPVVTFLGHVDHGKTSLLDRIRKANVASTEHGGITQHIGAYKIELRGKHIVFLDTPGHEAFTEMRSRGANATDIVVLVVAADEGVMPQTEEAIDHARAAKVPIVVACNKVDKPTANPNMTKQQLSERDLLPEEWGGKTVFVEVSALTGQGVEELLDMLLLEAELLELAADPRLPASGVVLEASMVESKGPVATVLVRRGTLRIGDVLLAGKGYGRARALVDDRGVSRQEAQPSSPIQVLGWSELPEAGDKFYVVRDFEKARAAAFKRQERERNESLARARHVTLETFFQSLDEGKPKELRIILKADVKGSAEVLSRSLTELSTDEIKVSLLRAGVGAINHSDVILADASDAIIIGFYVGPDEKARALAAEKGVDIREYHVIFHVVDEVRAAMEGMLEPEEREESLGKAAVKQVFRISKVGHVCGCLVSEGKIERSNRVRLLRDGKAVYSGRIESLKRFQEDTSEVKAGYECGIRLQGHNDVKEGDIIEAFEIRKIARKLR